MQNEFKTLAEAQAFFNTKDTLATIVSTCRLTAAVEIREAEDFDRLRSELDRGRERHNQLVVVFRLPQSCSLTPDEERDNRMRDMLGDNLR